MFFLNGIISFINKGHKRTIKAKKNIIASAFFQGSDKALKLLLVSIALNYLGPTRYGIWLTISSITAYFMLFDIGLGSGLRTKFAEAVALGDKQRAKVYVSTTYFIVFLMMISFFILFLFLSPLFDWTKILNTSPYFYHELNTLALIVVSFFSFYFIFQLIFTILVADQRPAIRDLINFIAQAVTVGIIFVLVKTTSVSLINFGLVYSAVPVFILLFASIYFFKKDYNEYLPSLRHVNFKYHKDLIHLGLKFFIIKINVVILFSTDNLIIAQLYDPSQVAIYQIAHRYFFMAIILFSLITGPFWGMVTEAYNKGEYRWIRDSVRKLLKISTIIIFIIVIMLIFSKNIYSIWVGGIVSIPFKLSLGMALFAAVKILGTPFSSFANGVGKLKIRTYVALFSSLVNIPLSIIFAKYLNMGLVGIILATVVCLLMMIFVNCIQYYKIMNFSAKGIWNQ